MNRLIHGRVMSLIQELADGVLKRAIMLLKLHEWLLPNSRNHRTETSSWDAAGGKIDWQS